MELGVPLLQFVQWIYRQEPKSIKATATLNDDGVDLDATAELSYGDNKVAKIKASVLETLTNAAKVVGTKGTMTVNKFVQSSIYRSIIIKMNVQVPSFWTATSVNINGTEKSFPALPQGKYEFKYENSSGFIYEVEEVRKCIRGGKKESELASHNESLLIACIQDKIRKQIGLKYSADN